MDLKPGPTRVQRGGKWYVVCPSCGKDMSAHALLCRDCFYDSGSSHGGIYRAASERGEASPRSMPKPEGVQPREYTKNPSQKR